jgi:hypothetical protein
MAVSRYMKPGYGARYAVKIITVDPKNRKIEAALKDQTVVQVAVFDTREVFVWPQVGEQWIIQQASGIWTLDKRVGGKDDLQINDLEPGHGKIAADVVKTPTGQSVVITDDKNADSHSLLSYQDSKWQPAKDIKINSVDVANTGSVNVGDSGSVNVGSNGTIKVANTDYQYVKLDSAGIISLSGRVDTDENQGVTKQAYINFESQGTINFGGNNSVNDYYGHYGKILFSKKYTNRLGLSENNIGGEIWFGDSAQVSFGNTSQIVFYKNLEQEAGIEPLGGLISFGGDGLIMFEDSQGESTNGILMRGTDGVIEMGNKPVNVIPPARTDYESQKNFVRIYNSGQMFMSHIGAYDTDYGYTNVGQNTGIYALNPQNPAGFDPNNNPSYYSNRIIPPAFSGISSGGAPWISDKYVDTNTELVDNTRIAKNIVSTYTRPYPSAIIFPADGGTEYASSTYWANTSFGNIQNWYCWFSLNSSVNSTLATNATKTFVLSKPYQDSKVTLTNVTAPSGAGRTNLVVSDIEGIYIGSTVTGTGISAGTTVTNIVESTKTVTIDPGTTSAWVNQGTVAFNNQNVRNARSWVENAFYKVHLMGRTGSSIVGVIASIEDFSYSGEASSRGLAIKLYNATGSTRDLSPCKILIEFTTFDWNSTEEQLLGKL